MRAKPASLLRPVLLSLLFSCVLATGCRSTNSRNAADPAAAVDAAPSGNGISARAAAPSCQESCAGTYASAKLMGCVRSCSQWQGKSLTLNVGRSQFPSLPPAPHCTFTYEARDAAQVQPGMSSQLYSFGFRYSDGVGDGGFLITGSGITDTAALLDFSRASDQKVFAHADLGVSTSLSFRRQDPALAGVPTVTIQETVREDNEVKTLVLTLDREFNAADPFAKVVAARFTDRVGQESKHDILCRP